MGFDRCDNPTKHCCWNYVYFIEQDKTPFTPSKKVHHLLWFVRSIMRVCNHGVRGHQDPTVTCKLWKEIRWFDFDVSHRIKLTFSFWSAVNTAIWRSVTFDHWRNCCLHCMTDTLKKLTRKALKKGTNTYDDVQSTRHDFLIVQAAVIPTRVLPAPHGKTMIPERARLFKIWEKGSIPLISTRTHFQTSCLD